MRFVIAAMRHETNTFSPIQTPLSAFGRNEHDGPHFGDEAITAYEGTNNPIAAYISLSRQEGAEFFVPVAAIAHPGGKVADEAFYSIADSICGAVDHGCDAVFLDLHGAMVTESLDDGEGELLRRIRKIAPDLPIGVALDFHTNLTASMVAHSTVITAYRTYPHVDMYETGLRAGMTLLASLKGEMKPKMIWQSLPMMTHMLRQSPSQRPMKDIMDKAIESETKGLVLNASILGGFPLSDTPHVGLSALAVTDGDTSPGQCLVNDLLNMAWNSRENFVYSVEPVKISVNKAKELQEGPIILVDHGDNCGAGGCQDVMTVLEEVIRQELDDVAAGPFVDADAVDKMIGVGVGSHITLKVGGKTHMPAINMRGKPLTISGTIKCVTDGKFTITGPMMTGMPVNLGRTAVLDTGKIEIVVSEQRFEPYDMGCFTHAGIDPVKKRYVLIKSRQHFRAVFEPIAKHIVLIDGPGVCNSDYSQFPFRNLRRPIYPLDPDLLL